MSKSQPAHPPSATDTRLETLLDEYDVEKITGRSVASLRRDRLLGIGIPYSKLRALVRYRPADIHEYISSNMRGGKR